MFGNKSVYNLIEDIDKLQKRTERLQKQIVDLEDRLRKDYARRDSMGDYVQTMFKRTNIDIDGHDIPVNNLVVALINYLNLDVVEIKHAYVLEERDAK